jgi:glycosyltransferase involved in cell wall biosynthesis
MADLSVIVDARGWHEEGTGISRYVQRLLEECACLCPNTVQPLGWPSQFRRLRRSGFRPSLMMPDRYRIRWPLRSWDIAHGPDFFAPPVQSRHRVITVHDFSFIRFPRMFPDGFSETIASRLREELERTDAVLCDSVSTRDDLINFFGADPARAHVTYLGTDLNSLCHERGVRPPMMRHPYILHSGAMVPRKNIPLLLDAYRLLRKDFALDVDLVLTGSKAIGWATDWPRIERWLHENADLSGQIHLSGYLNRCELARLLDSAEVYAHPSVWEGFGLPVLDALAAGTAVVCFRRGGVPEYAGEAPYYAEDSVEGLASAIVEALTDGADRAEKLRCGRQAAAQLTWRRTAQGTLDVYRSLVS